MIGIRRNRRAMLIEEVLLLMLSKNDDTSERMGICLTENFPNKYTAKANASHKPHKTISFLIWILFDANIILYGFLDNTPHDIVLRRVSQSLDAFSISITSKMVY